MMAGAGSTLETAIHTRVGFFVTRVERRLADGRRLVSHSRWHRKGLPPVQVASDGTELALPGVSGAWLKFWAPQRLAWWIAVLFIIGSACFAAGSFASNWPQFTPSGFTSSHSLNMTFFIGSLFFTGAAWLQLLEAINGDIADIDAEQRSWHWFAFKPHNAGYSASLIQFIGTLLFNFNTADAMLTGLGWKGEELLVWGPDAIGSICFLLASYLALIEVSHSYWSFQPHQISWWIVIINLAGSVAFMLSALFSFVLPASANPEWVWGANAFTLLGAICFLFASYLMIPELSGAGRAGD